MIDVKWARGRGKKGRAGREWAMPAAMTSKGEVAAGIRDKTAL